MKHTFENARITNGGDYVQGTLEGDGDGSRNTMAFVDATQSLERALAICLGLRGSVFIWSFNQYRHCMQLINQVKTTTFPFGLQYATQ